MLPQLQAERQLLAIEAASVPHMEQRSRAKVIGRYERHARDATRAKSTFEALIQAGVPVHDVPTSKGTRAATGQAGTRRKGKRG
jgi:hypothetical protein